MKLKHFIQELLKYDQESEVVLVDMTTDDGEMGTYTIKPDQISDCPLVDIGTGEGHGQEIKGVGISFENRFNENPI